MRQINCEGLHFGYEQSYGIAIDKFPDKCPVCNKHMRPEDIGAFQTGKFRVEIVYQCTNEECSRLFIGYYKLKRINTGRNTHNNWFFQNCLPTVYDNVRVPEEINNISSEFEKIYNQANQAEDSGLSHIAGMGYRKSLEFLIKDFLIEHEEHDKETIEKKFLGKCIEEHIEHEQIKALAERATWLGNDESHFVRRWEDKSIDDLKDLIELVVSWIRQVILTQKLIESMPDPKGQSLT